MKGVVAIPLTESAATAALNSLAARGQLSGTSPGPGNSLISGLSDVASDDEYPTLLSESNPKRGQFAASIPPPAADPVFNPAPDANLNPDPVARPASISSPSSRSVGKTVVNRLSFWKFRSKPKRQSSVSDPATVVPSVPPIPAVVETPPTPHVPVAPPVPELLEGLPEGRKGSQEEGLGSVLNSPQTAEEKSTELEAKIINECIRLFAHEMYFAYDFGA